MSESRTTQAIISRHSCCTTLELNADHIQHFKTRFLECGLTATNAAIVIISPDDVHGRPITDLLMPGFNWQEIRDRGGIPFACGILVHAYIQGIVEAFDQEAAAKLRGMTEVAVVII